MHEESHEQLHLGLGARYSVAANIGLASIV